MKRKAIFSILLVISLLFSSFNISLAVDLDNLTEYNMELILNDESRTVEGILEVEFINTYEDTLKELVFHLYADSYKSYETLPAIGGVYVYPGEEVPELTEAEKGYIEIKDVSIAGEKAKYTKDNQILKVQLKDPLKNGHKVGIRIEFLLKVPEGYNRLHYMEGVYSLTNWYPLLSIYDEETDTWDERPFHPIGESNYSDVANYNVRIKVPKDMTVVPTGSILKEMEDDEYKIVTIRAEKVRDFVIFMSKAYKVKEKEVDDIKISCYYLDHQYGSNEKSAEILLNEVAKTVEFMNKTFGKYPYGELRIAETYLSGGAMEYPQVIQMGWMGIYEEVNIEDQAPWLIEAAVHEAIHQWWYVGVGNDEFSEPFLDESLTVFTTAYYFEKVYDEYHENGVKSSIRRFLYPESLLPLNSSVDDFYDWGAYSTAIYSRGATFFEDLRQRVGEDKFVEILRTYYERYLFKNASIDDLLGIIGEIAGEEVEKIMYEAVSSPNYYPENIILTPEEEQVFNIRWEIRRLKSYEEQNGLVIGSIILDALEGEDLIIVKPSYINERDTYAVDGLISSIMDTFNYNYGIEVDLVEEENLTREHKNSNLIVIGYPEKSSLIKDMSKSLPVDLTSDTIEINKVSIKNDGISGMFIAENPYNKDFLSLIIFLVDEDMEDKSSLQEGDSGEIYVYDDILIYSYNPLYADDVQFVIHVDDIEIRGLYK